MPNELKPCLFCKMMPYVDEDDGFPPFFVQCSACGAAGPRKRTREAAIAAWNTRNSHAALVTALKYLIRVRGIKCLHEGGPDVLTCALCKARAALRDAGEDV
jgi:hypothetical protein